MGDYDVSPADAKILTFWRDLYDGIGRANMLIKYIDKPQLDEATRNNIYGQALFLRAYYHFLLVVRFHNIPLILSVPEDGNREACRRRRAARATFTCKSSRTWRSGSAGPHGRRIAVAGPCQPIDRLRNAGARGPLHGGLPVKEPGMYAKAKEYAQKVIDTGAMR